jgi:23S rRNA (pseudouridine1915-N3)-methyltransferase
MKIKIIIPGKTKEKFLQEGEKGFQKRLRRFCHLDWIIIKEEKISANKTGQIIRLKEAESIVKHITKGAYTIALDQTGDQVSSEELAEYLQQKMNEGVGELTFIIGGALGLDESILNAANKILSLSRMTFTHEMSRLILLEQLYRAFTILKGEKYHKG